MRIALGLISQFTHSALCRNQIKTYYPRSDKEIIITTSGPRLARMSSSQTLVTEAEAVQAATKRDIEDPDHEKEEVDPEKRLKPDDEAKDETEPEPYDGPRWKYRKFAVCLSYCGQGYYGMQRNPGYPSIEMDLQKSWLETGMMRHDSFERPTLIRFQRSCRTDKNVSAVRQIISCKLPDVFPDKIAQVNEKLDIISKGMIRVMGAKRVTKNFDSKTACDGRTYCYMTPTFALAPLEEKVTFDYRVPSEKIEEMNHLLAHYKGTHNYHNFTSGKGPSDPSSKRFMVDLSCGQPFVLDGVEFVVIQVKGQSFMLHQIRKMVGLCFAIMRGFATLDTLKQCFDPARMDIPMAPGLGLMLDTVHFDRYNKRFCCDGSHEPLEWNAAAGEIDRFKHEKIYPVIVKTEKEQLSMIKWLETLSLHSYDTNCRPHRSFVPYNKTISLDDDQEGSQEPAGEAESGPEKTSPEIESSKAFRKAAYTVGMRVPVLDWSAVHPDKDEETANNESDDEPALQEVTKNADDDQ